MFREARPPSPRRSCVRAPLASTFRPVRWTPAPGRPSKKRRRNRTTAWARTITRRTSLIAREPVLHRRFTTARTVTIRRRRTEVDSTPLALVPIRAVGAVRLDRRGRDGQDRSFWRSEAGASRARPPDRPRAQRMHSAQAAVPSRPCHAPAAAPERRIQLVGVPPAARHRPLRRRAGGATAQAEQLETTRSRGLG